MAPRTSTEKKPRGRKPLGAVDGRWHLIEESLKLAAERMIRYREHNRKRYHEMRDLLRIEHPELFVREDPQWTLLTDKVPPTRLNERVCDLTCYQKDSSNTSEPATPPHASTGA